MQAQSSPSPTADRIDRFLAQLLRHWLALFLTPTVDSLSPCPFLAPVATHWGWEGVGRLLYVIYSPFCHQLPQRSFFFFGETTSPIPLPKSWTFYPYNDPWQIAPLHRQRNNGLQSGVERPHGQLLLHDTCLRACLSADATLWTHKLKPIPFWLMLLTLVPIAIDGTTHIFSDALYGVSAGGFRDTNAVAGTVDQQCLSRVSMLVTTMVPSIGGCVY